jgi:DNA-binding transcriptional ArsR family regulator
MSTDGDIDFALLERLFLALGDKTRLKLLALMADGPVAVGVLADNLGESQPKTSRHLAYMRQSGIVSTQRDGKWIYYGIKRPVDGAVLEILETAIASVVGRRADSNSYFADSSDETPALPANETRPDESGTWANYVDKDMPYIPATEEFDNYTSSENQTTTSDEREMDIFLL